METEAQQAFIGNCEALARVVNTAILCFNRDNPRMADKNTFESKTESADLWTVGRLIAAASHIDETSFEGI